MSFDNERKRKAHGSDQEPSLLGRELSDYGRKEGFLRSGEVEITTNASSVLSLSVDSTSTDESDKVAPCAQDSASGTQEVAAKHISPSGTWTDISPPIPAVFGKAPDVTSSSPVEKRDSVDTYSYYLTNYKKDAEKVKEENKGSLLVKPTTGLNYAHLMRIEPSTCESEATVHLCSLISSSNLASKSHFATKSTNEGGTNETRFSPNTTRMILDTDPQLPIPNCVCDLSKSEPISNLTLTSKKTPSIASDTKETNELQQQVLKTPGANMNEDIFTKRALSKSEKDEVPLTHLTKLAWGLSYEKTFLSEKVMEKSDHQTTDEPLHDSLQATDRSECILMQALSREISQGVVNRHADNSKEHDSNQVLPTVEIAAKKKGIFKSNSSHLSNETQAMADILNTVLDDRGKKVLDLRQESPSVVPLDLEFQAFEKKNHARASLEVPHQDGSAVSAGEEELVSRSEEYQAETNTLNIPVPCSIRSLGFIAIKQQIQPSGAVTSILEENRRTSRAEGFIGTSMSLCPKQEQNDQVPFRREINTVNLTQTIPAEMTEMKARSAQVIDATELLECTHFVIPDNASRTENFTKISTGPESAQSSGKSIRSPSEINVRKVISVEYSGPNRVSEISRPLVNPSVTNAGSQVDSKGETIITNTETVEAKAGAVALCIAVISPPAACNSSPKRFFEDQNEASWQDLQELHSAADDLDQLYDSLDDASDVLHQVCSGEIAERNTSPAPGTSSRHDEETESFSATVQTEAKPTGSCVTPVCKGSKSETSLHEGQVIDRSRDPDRESLSVSRQKTDSPTELQCTSSNASSEFKWFTGSCLECSKTSRGSPETGKRSVLIRNKGQWLPAVSDVQHRLKSPVSGGQTSGCVHDAATEHSLPFLNKARAGESVEEKLSAKLNTTEIRRISLDVLDQTCNETCPKIDDAISHEADGAFQSASGITHFTNQSLVLGVNKISKEYYEAGQSCVSSRSPIFSTKTYGKPSTQLKGERKTSSSSTDAESNDSLLLSTNVPQSNPSSYAVPVQESTGFEKNLSANTMVTPEPTPYERKLTNHFSDHFSPACISTINNDIENTTSPSNEQENGATQMTVLHLPPVQPHVSVGIISQESPGILYTSPSSSVVKITTSEQLRETLSNVTSGEIKKTVFDTKEMKHPRTTFEQEGLLKTDPGCKADLVENRNPLEMWDIAVRDRVESERGTEESVIRSSLDTSTSSSATLKPRTPTERPYVKNDLADPKLTLSCLSCKVDEDSAKKKCVKLLDIVENVKQSEFATDTDCQSSEPDKNTADKLLQNRDASSFHQESCDHVDGGALRDTFSESIAPYFAIGLVPAQENTVAESIICVTHSTLDVHAWRETRQGAYLNKANVSRDDLEYKAELYSKKNYLDVGSSYFKDDSGRDLQAPHVRRTNIHLPKKLSEVESDVASVNPAILSQENPIHQYSKTSEDSKPCHYFRLNGQNYSSASSSKDQSRSTVTQTSEPRNSLPVTKERPKLDCAAGKTKEGPEVENRDVIEPIKTVLSPTFSDGLKDLYSNARSQDSDRCIRSLLGNELYSAEDNEVLTNVSSISSSLSSSSHLEFSIPSSNDCFSKLSRGLLRPQGNGTSPKLRILIPPAPSSPPKDSHMEHSTSAGQTPRGLPSLQFFTSTSTSATSLFSPAVDIEELLADHAPSIDSLLSLPKPQPMQLEVREGRGGKITPEDLVSLSGDWSSEIEEDRYRWGEGLIHWTSSPNICTETYQDTDGANKCELDQQLTGKQTENTESDVPRYVERLVFY
ncbi:unnamed protein product [Schistocephalus solidus]|uniref:ALMS1 protein n=1 Tax=Schistocephalus solidus TaxID=70667 RepID=A0A183SD88_SCHSO|nr:unnamed protein product [Schistocephalus solidus]